MERRSGITTAGRTTSWWELPTLWNSPEFVTTTSWCRAGLSSPGGMTWTPRVLTGRSAAGLPWNSIYIALISLSVSVANIPVYGTVGEWCQVFHGCRWAMSYDYYAPCFDSRQYPIIVCAPLSWPPLNVLFPMVINQFGWSTEPNGTNVDRTNTSATSSMHWSWPFLQASGVFLMK